MIFCLLDLQIKKIRQNDDFLWDKYTLTISNRKTVVIFVISDPKNPRGRRKNEINFSTIFSHACGGPLRASPIKAKSDEKFFCFFDARGGFLGR